MIDTITAQQQSGHQVMIGYPTTPVEVERLNPFGVPQDFCLSGDLGKPASFILSQHREESNALSRFGEFPHPPVYSILSIHELFERQQQAALKDLRRAPSNIHLVTNTGVALMNTGELEKAKNYFKQALQLNPTFFKAQANLARVYQLQGDIDSAIEIYTNLLKVAPNHPLTIENLVSLHLAKGKYELCQPLLDKLIKVRPDNPSAYMLKAIFHLATQQVEKAVGDFRKAARLDIRQAQIHNGLGVCYAILSSHKKAIRSFQAALTIDPDNREATLNLARAYEQAGQLIMTIELLTKYVERHETDWEAQDLLAKALFLSGDYKKSLSHLLLIEKHAMIENWKKVDLISLYNNLGLVYAREGKIDKARETYERCLALEADEPLVYYNFVMFLLDRKHWKRADEIIHQMQQKFPDDSRVTLLKGRYFYEHGRFDDAVDYLQQAIQFRPDEIIAYCLLGDILSEIQGNYRASIAMLEQALDHNPNNAILLNNLAYNYLMVDELEKARRVLDRANEQDSPIFLTATRGLLLLKEDNLKEGQRLYNKAASLAKNEELRRMIHQKKSIEIAKYYLEQNNRKQAIKFLNSVIKLKTRYSAFQRQARALLQRLKE